ncbi:MAG: UvrD-helicase domain-containing protein [Oscillospiraceae bacterium]|nr:UvrD-helicase domain-containing protein [Oscillospiraceae bacterium]
MSDKINWTSEQSAAISAKGRAVLVSAAAGSGKTAVLVERLTRLLTDMQNPLPADSIVVVTFTKDAAAQMKTKLTNALSKRLCDEDTTEEEAEHISSQLALLPSANISTIHSYCFRLIRENSGLAGVDPAFAIADSDDEKNIILKAAENAFEKYIKNSPEKMKTLTDFFCSGEKNIENLTDIILELREKYLTLPFPRDKMDGLVKYYKENSVSFSPGKGVAADYLKLAAERLESAADAAKSLSAYLEHVKEDLPESERENDKLLKNIAAAAETANDDYFLLKKLSDNLAEEIAEIFAGHKNTCSLFDPPTPIEAGKEKTDKKGTVTYSKKTIPSIKYEKDGKEIDISSNVKEVRKLYYKTASELYEFLNTGASAPAGTPLRFTEEQIKSDYKKHGEILELLFELLKEVMDRESDLKAERNVLGFSDAEQLTCNLLCRKDGENILPTETAKNISDSVNIVMIDEFQDSTEIQELIFRMLSRGGSAKAPGSNFFAVGDVKQSIYRFRSAEPGLFMKSLKESVPYGDKGETPSHILLRRNFRSRQPVVDFVNRFFTAVMSERRGGVDYGEADSLVCGREALPCSEFPAEIIDITDEYAHDRAKAKAIAAAKKKSKENSDTTENEDTEDSASEKLTSEDFAEAEAAAVAARIKELISEDPEARLGDFCILSRYSHYFPIHARALKEAGLPSVSPAKTDLLETGETLAVINLLRAVDNPWKDVPLMAAMMSPLFMFTAEEMALIRLLGGNEEGGSLYGRIASVAQTGNANENTADAIRQRCINFLEKFGKLREYALTHTSREMILHIYEDMDYGAVTARSEGGREKSKNLDALANAAANADKRGDGSVASFVRRIEALKNSGSGMPVQTAVGGGAVVIQTIHRSKGLEYPYVFLCGTEKTVHDARSAACFYPTAGVGLDITRAAETENNSRERLRYKTLPSCTVKAMKQRSESDEDMMLLYVALTRARERLFITRRKGSGESKKSIVSAILSEGARRCGEPKRDCAAIAQSSLADIIASGLAEFGFSKEISHYDPIEGTLRLNIPKSSGAVDKEALPDDTDKEFEEESKGKEAAENIDSEIYETVAGLLEIRSGISYEPIPAKLTVSQIAKKRETASENVPPQPVFTEIIEKDNVPFEFPEIDSYDPQTEDEEEIIRPVPGKLTAADRGNAYHAFMQQADLYRLHNAGDIETAIVEEIEALAHKGVVTEAQAECIDPKIIVKFTRSRLFSRMMKEGEFMRERKFLVKISDLGLDDNDLKVYNNTEGMLQGVADLIFKEGDGYVLCDYKTDRNASPEVLVNRYSRQLRLYAAAFSLILGAPVKEALIYSFSLGEEINVKL